MTTQIQIESVFIFPNKTGLTLHISPLAKSPIHPYRTDHSANLGVPRWTFSKRRLYVYIRITNADESEIKSKTFHNHLVLNVLKHYMRTKVNE